MRNGFRTWVLLVSAVVSAASGQSQGASQKADEAGTAVVPVVSQKQKKLVEDSEKLVQMAAELKVSVDKAGKNELSMDVVRKAEAVEKLAKSLKERIREAR